MTTIHTSKKTTQITGKKTSIFMGFLAINVRKILQERAADLQGISQLMYVAAHWSGAKLPCTMTVIIAGDVSVVNPRESRTEY